MFESCLSLTGLRHVLSQSASFPSVSQVCSNVPKVNPSLLTPLPLSLANQHILQARRVKLLLGPAPVNLPMEMAADGDSLFKADRE